MSETSKIRVELSGSVQEIEPLSSSVSGSVIELSPGHFIVSAGGSIDEVFVTKSGTLSDGNALDGIEIKVESERERIMRERFNDVGGSAAAKTGAFVLKAPMPGLVRAISVAVGDSVSKNTVMVVLEAMKMENNITAGVKGIVQKILVEQGSSVEKNAKLIEIELEA